MSPIRLCGRSGCLQPRPGERLAPRPDPVGDHQLLTVLRPDPNLLDRLLPDDVDANSGCTPSLCSTAVAKTTSPPRQRSSSTSSGRGRPMASDRIGCSRRRWRRRTSTRRNGHSQRAGDPSRRAQRSHPPLPASEPGGSDTRRRNQVQRLGIMLTTMTKEARTSSYGCQPAATSAGDLTAALAAINEAATLYRALTQASPPFAAHFAYAMNRPGHRSHCEVGDRTGALAAVEEASTLYPPLLRPTGLHQTSRRHRATWPAGAPRSANQH